MDCNQGQASTFYTPGGTGARFGGGVYQHFAAPSVTFINVFSQPGAYNVSLSFAGAAGQENPASVGLNRQLPMTAGAQASGPGRIPIMNGPINHPGEQEVYNLSPYVGSVINGKGGSTAIQLMPKSYSVRPTLEGRKLQDKPVPPIKRLSIGTQTQSP